MRLYLIQHGEAVAKEVHPDRPLTDSGRDDVRLVGAVLAGAGVRISRVINSGKVRARQTAEIFAHALHPKDGVHQIEGIKPMDDVTSIAPGLNPEDGLMLVGHLPFMSRLAAYLVSGRIEPPVFKFQNSGIVCLDRKPDEKYWQIVWTLMPHIGQIRV
jgi:phosphohistidine phosphatase